MFGELVCGPPGSGKTTYCEGKRQFLKAYDPSRPTVLINLDPANDGVFPYPCDVDIRDIICHSVVMEEEHLGPNGSYLFCADALEQSMDDLMAMIQAAAERRLYEARMETAGGREATVRAPYLIIDCPGQVEFYVNSRAMQVLFKRIQKRLLCTLCTVHLVDASIATRDIATYVSSCLLALSTVVDHELPHLHVMTKWDTLTHDTIDEGVPFLNVSGVAEEDFDRLWKQQLRQRRLAHLRARYHASKTEPVMSTTHNAELAGIANIDLERDGGKLYKYAKAVMDVIEGFGLVGFTPLDVQSEQMMLQLTQQIDNAVGNFF